ncbi:MAG: NAD-dependent epimerase/dehydratase family protein [Paracoccus sp. (in: a-proteobacteria)]|uniref:NAD-dependent epimerase/dehydratase family protein n=1 Tax=Paracoccus sp. TaxID=267 RepID=UPI0026DF3170|nr:NAD-dependent epimerase/dehydratase family protein [Paracoccus sp. (in: a-proteobacteria)]MDO5622710.1 NAD-dependent epimerase/dehydratase family protein [Paracoccus sp. (in: a-proteobacteria)]
MQAMGSNLSQVAAQGKTALVTGGGGFIGQALLPQLVQDGWQVRNLDFVPSAFQHEAVTHWQGSFTNSDLLHESLSGVDCILHLASTHFPQEANVHPDADATSGVLGVIAMARMAQDRGVGRIVFASSGGTVYGVPETVPIPETHPTRPITAYGISKLSAEHYLRFFDLGQVSTLSLRIANPYGPGQNIRKAQGALTTFCHHAAKGLPIEIWGDGLVERDFVHVEDVARALAMAARADVHGTEINIGSGHGLSLNRLLDLIRANGFEPDVTYRPARSFDVPRSVLSIKRARALLGWTPEIEVKAGIASMLRAFSETTAARQDL